MTASYTRTYTVVKTRLESIEDQFAHFLQFGSVPEAKAERILVAVGNKWLEAVGLFIEDKEGLRLAETELHVDWEKHGQLSIVQPTVDLDLPGWSDTMSPEVKLAGRRFATLARELDRPVRFWVRFTDAVRADEARYKELCEKVGVSYGASAPQWRSAPMELRDTLLDLPEAEFVIRRAGSQE